MAQRIEEKIWTAIKDLLIAGQVAGQQLEYVKKVFEGFRPLPQGVFPALIMEPDSDLEVPHTSSRFVRLTDRIKIFCITEHVNPENQIIAVDPKKGIKDLVGDVKNTVAVNLKLGLGANNVLFVRFPSVEYTPAEQTYPQREAVITVEVEATFQDTNR